MYTWNIHILIKLKLVDDECKRRHKSLQEEVGIDVGTKNSKTMNYSGKLNSASTLEQPSHLAP